MLSEIKETLDKWSKDLIYVGFDFGYEYAQISYMMHGDEPQTLPVPGSAGSFNIPTVLFKKAGTAQWFCGQDAKLAILDHEEGFPVWKLLALAEEKDTIMLGDEEYAVADLIALFLKRSFLLLPVMSHSDKIVSVAITVHNANAKIKKMINRALSVLKLREDQVFVISYEESYYGFVSNQESELRKQQVLLCDLSGKDMNLFFMEKNPYSVPKVVSVTEYTSPAFLKEYEEPDEVLDGRFLALLKKHCEGRVISSAYLIGEGFDRGFCKEALSYLCRNRRVFCGNNLFSKGACYVAAARMEQQKEDPDEIFLGKDMLKANIGIKVYQNGVLSYVSLLEAGCNWYDAKCECDLILKEEYCIPIIVTPLCKKNTGIGKIMLDGLVYRKKPYHRVRFRLEMESEVLVRVRVRDMGFGEKETAVDYEWVEEFEIP